MQFDQATLFLSTLFAPGDTILLRPIEAWTDPSAKPPRQTRVIYDSIRYSDPSPLRLAVDLAAMDRVASKERANIFFGVCSRFGRNHFDLAWQIRTVRTLWADLDNIALADALAKIDAAGLPKPSIQVFSGNGCHLYWLLADPVHIDDVGDPPAVLREWPKDESCQQSSERKGKPTSYYMDASGTRINLDRRTKGPSLSPKAQHVQDILQGIAAAIGGDSTHDLARLLRVPGTSNRKDERNGRPPVPCSLIELDGSRLYPLADFDRFAAASPIARQRKQAAAMPLPVPRKATARKLDKLAELLAICSLAEPGTRSERDFDLCAYAIRNGIDQSEVWTRASTVGKFAENGERYFQLTWDKAADDVRLAKHVELSSKLAGANGHHGNGPASASTNGNGSGNLTFTADQLPSSDIIDQPPAAHLIECDDDPHRLARVFLSELSHASQHGSHLGLRYWREEWWEWTGKAYRKTTDSVLRAKFTSCVKREFDRIHQSKKDQPYIEGQDNRVQKVTKTVVSNAMGALEGLAVVGSEIDQPSMLGQSRRSLSSIALANGILDIDRVLAGGADVISPHTPLWFSRVCLSYSFDPSATCPKWLAFLDRVMESDAARIAILQEWAGYLLLPDTSQQRFLFMEGEGANGKSVYCAAIEAMLGPENTSHVSLEMFSNNFSLSSTLGKLANIAAEVGEIDRPAEGFLKSFTSGDRMSFDRKHKPPIEAEPTARLMLASNNRPRFSDKSGGLWRRMLLIPFRITIAESERIYGMDKIDWWERSGELPGIFNWAIAGLHRLRTNSKFTASEISIDAIADYQQEINPAKAFLLEHYEPSIDPDIRTPSAEMYEEYKAWCQKTGHQKSSDKTFGKEVKRSFPNMQRRQHQSDGKREWCYFGVSLKTDDLF